MTTSDYQRGYAAGRRKGREDAERGDQRERVYLRSLELVMTHCGNGWTIGDKEVNNAEMYCKLARSFADHAINEQRSGGVESRHAHESRKYGRLVRRKL